MQAVPNVPQRIASRLTSRPKPQNAIHSAINVDSEIECVDESNNTLQRVVGKLKTLITYNEDKMVVQTTKELNT